MKNQTISRDNLKQIYDVACSSWKTKIEDYAKRNPFGNEIEFSKAEIDEMFSASDSKQKAILNKFFQLPKNIMDTVKSFKDACSVLGIHPESVYSTSDTKDEIAFKKLKVIIKALNEGWYPNWDNSNEAKYFNYFNMERGFSSYATNYNSTTTSVPSALYLRTRELAQYCAKIAYEEYKDYLS